MKAITITISAVAAVAVLGGIVMAPKWIQNSVMKSGFEYTTTDTNYELEVSGWNARVYEWTPKGDPNAKCLLLSTGGKNSINVQCWNTNQTMYKEQTK
jgi:hypothetical protein